MDLGHSIEKGGYCFNRTGVQVKESQNFPIPAAALQKLIFLVAKITLENGANNSQNAPAPTSSSEFGSFK